MTASAGARLTGGATGLIGREDELATLRLILADDGPRVLFLHGIGGVGKSALLEAFSASAREGGAIVIRLDGGAIEPTARGFTSALSAATGPGPDGDANTVARLAHAGSPAIIVVDRYEVLRPLDVWLPQSFVPLDARRHPPASRGWRAPGGRLADSGSATGSASLALGNLHEPPHRACCGATASKNEISSASSGWREDIRCRCDSPRHLWARVSLAIGRPRR